RSLGAHALRGRGAPLSVATLERGAAETAPVADLAPRRAAVAR
ncbi:adenylate/guanylate cyclase domain-containing protein, partial [Methylobacterium sp. A52T]